MDDDDAKGDWTGYSDIEDVTMVAYLHCRGHDFEAIDGGGRRVIFRVFGKNIDQHIREMHEGYKVPVNQYLKSFKYARGALYNKKAELGYGSRKGNVK